MPQRTTAFSFDSFTLKMIAIIAMAIDHAGYLLFNHNIWLNIIGRLTIPIMAFFIVEGYHKTNNMKRYMLRLLIFAVISMYPYYISFKGSPTNVLYNLLFGLIVLYLADKLRQEWQKWSIVLFFTVLAYLLHTDGIYVVVPLIYLMHKYRGNFRKMALAVTIFILAASFLPIIYGYIVRDPNQFFNIYNWIRPFSLLALLLLRGYNGQKGRGIKYLFYIFYPGHLLILYLLTYLI